MARPRNNPMGTRGDQTTGTLLRRTGLIQILLQEQFEDNDVLPSISAKICICINERSKLNGVWLEGWDVCPVILKRGGRELNSEFAAGNEESDTAARTKVGYMGATSKKQLQLVQSKLLSRATDGGRQRRIAILALPNTALSDLAGPYEAFLMGARLGQARLRLENPYYEVTLLSIAGNSIATLSGLGVTGARSFRTYKGTPDTLVVTGEPNSLDASGDHSALFGWLRGAAAESRRVCSVCTGIFCLAEAGLLDDRRVTTHWKYAETLARKYPAMHVDPEPLFLRDGKFYTSAGCTAAMDLSLALIEEDLGVEIATEIARDTLMFLRRPGRQAQISPLLKLQISDREPLRELQTWMLEHLHLPLTVEDLAVQVHMSPRNFARSFVAAVGTTPARFLETLRVEAARRRLEETSQGMDQIASECGFGSAETMRRTFVRNLGTPPSAYRRQSGVA